MSRILAIDYGKKRTGVAVTDVLPMNIIGWMVSVRKRTAPEWSITIGEVQWKIIVSEHMNF